jgi:anthranilate synthase component 1
MTPDRDTYCSLAATHDVVPVYLELLADRETPVSVLQRFSSDENVFLLESMEGGEKWGRYSFIGVRPTLAINVSHTGGPTGALDQLRARLKDLRVAAVPGLPPFIGGLVGFFGYEAIGDIERMPAPKTHRQGMGPCSQFLQADRLIVFDNVRHTVKIVYCSRLNSTCRLTCRLARIRLCRLCPT